MLTKKDLIRDFITFILCDLILNDAELITNKITQFYILNSKKHDVFPCQSNLNEGLEENYVEFLKKEVDIEQIIYKDLHPDDNSIFDNQILKNIIDYFEVHHRIGFPDAADEDGSFGGNHCLEFEIEEIEIYLNKYLEYSKINSNIYISFLLQKMIFLKPKVDVYLDDKGIIIDEFINKIKIYDDDETIKGLKNDFFEKNKAHYSQLISNEIILFGFSDDKGLFIDIEKTISKNLNNSQQVNYDYSSINFQDSFSYLTNQQLNYYLFGVKYPQHTNNSLEREFITFKSNHSEYVSFLKNKNFSVEEINSVLNFLSGNKFNDLNIRHLPRLIQAEYFNICYLLYIFDYFIQIEKKELIHIIDFSIVTSFFKNQLKEAKNEQFRKYYENINSNTTHKNYPFKRINPLIKQLEEKLKINRGNLKDIPTSSF